LLALGCLCASAVLAAPTLMAQTPQLAPPTSSQPVVGTSLILGQIVDAAGGGVSGVIVSLSGGLFQAGGFNTNLYASPIPGGPRRTQTTADGRFVFRDLPAGSYSLDATKPGYVPGALGRFRPGGIAQSLTLADGEKNGSVKISIWKYAAISGALVDDAGEPLVGVSVQAMRRSYELGRPQFSNAASSSTDDRGAFRLSSLTPGDYVMCVTATQSTVPVALAEAYAQARLTGATDLSRELSASGASTALGFGGGGIRVGDYLVQSSSVYGRSGAVPPEPADDGRLLSFQTTFFPGVFGLAQADVFSLASGEERSNVHMQLKLVPTAPVTGTVVGPDGPVPNMGVRLTAGYAGDLSFEESFDAAVAVTDANGSFRFLGVPVGQYSIRAIKVPMTPVVVRAPGQVVAVSGPPPSIPQGPTLWASVPVTVGAEGLSGITVRLNTGFRISGRFEFDGSTTKPPPAVVQTLSVLIQPIDGHQSGFSRALQSRVDPDGTITTYEVPPGKYSIRMAAPTESWQAMQGWTFESSVVDGRDVAATPLNLQADVTGLVITMSDHPSEITGTVRDESGKIDPTAAVIVFSADRIDWSNFGETPRRLRHLRTSAAGAYRIPALPPGQYFVAALPDAQAGDWQDPRVLQTLSRNAARVTLAKGEKKTQDVVVRPIR
jgi:hypothetical protein